MSSAGSRRLGERRSRSFVEPPFGAGLSKHRAPLYREQTRRHQASNVNKLWLISLAALTLVGSASGRASSTPTCSTSQLSVWLGIGDNGAAAGSRYYPLELTNVSHHRCRLFGFPGVSAVGRRRLGSPAERNRETPPRAVILDPGTSAHTVVQIADVANFSAAKCKPATASFLRVYPPDQRAAADIPFRFRACSKRGPIFLSVQPIQPGVGVPGG